MSTCPTKFQLARKKTGTISFVADYLWKIICKAFFLAKTPNLHNTCILFRESSFCARLLRKGDLINKLFQMHYAKIDFLIVMHFQSRLFEILTPARKPKFVAKVIGAKRSSK